MMLAAGAALGSAWLVGVLGVAAAWPRSWSVRADLPVILPLGFGLGLAATSVTFFLATVLSAHPLVPSAALDLSAAALLAARVRLRLRSVRAPAAGPERAGSAFGGLLAALLAQAAVVAAVVGARARAAEPFGHWDGWAIWNMHARFLYSGGDAFRRMLASPQLRWSHLDYPLLVPATIARAWAYCGGDPPAVSGLVALLFGAATVGLLAGAAARLRSPAQGCLAGLALLGTPFFVTFSASQYADVPLGFFILACAAAVALHGRAPSSRGLAALAGAAAGMAAWTKNEGLLFALVAAAAVGSAGRARSAGPRPWAFYGGLAAALLPVAYFKLALAPPNDVVTASTAGRLGQIADLSRHRTILSALGRFGSGFGEWRVLPYFALALPLMVPGRPRLGRHEWAVGGLVALTALGYYGVYLLTPWDLAWHLDASLQRLMVQLWPTLLLFWALCLGPVGAAAAPAGRPPSPSRRRAVAWFIAANAAASLLILRCLSGQLAPDELASGSAGGAAVRVGAQEGWFGREGDGRDTWVWSRGRSLLWVRVGGSRPVTVALEFQVRGLGRRTVTASLGGRTVWSASVGEGLLRARTADMALQPGLNTVAFSTDAPGVPESARGDARALTFALYDLRLR